MLARVLVVAVAIVLSASQLAAAGPICGFKDQVLGADFEFNHTLGPDLTLFWRLVQNAEGTQFTHICFGLVGDSSIGGWMGFGISGNPAGTMVPSGVVLMASTTTGFQVSARETKARDPSAVMPTTAFSIFEPVGASIGGRFNMQFGRLIDGNEAFAIKSNSMSKVVWAADPSAPGIPSASNNQLIQHSEANYLQINFFTGATLTPPPSTSDILKYLHGAFMFAAWAVAAPFMSVLARYKWRDWWFPVHKYVQMFVFALTMASFGMIVYVTQQQGQAHFSALHPIMGLCVVCATFLNPFLGLWADRSFDAKRHAVPLFPDRVHGIIGWLLYISSQVTLVLGLLYITSNDWQNGWVIAACVVIGVVFVLCSVPIVIEIYRSMLGLESSSRTRHVQGRYESHKLLDSNVERVSALAFGQT